MDTTVLFALALQLKDPWKLERVDFIGEEGKEELHLYIGFEKGAKFPCPAEGCTQSVGAYDTKEKVWRHLNFFQYKAYLHARVPRIDCPEHGVHQVDVPWAREGSGFTLLFEALVLEMAKHMPMERVAKLVQEHDTRLWRLVDHYVEEARTNENFEDVTALGMDETSKKGHNYISVFADLDTKKVLYVTEGKDNTTVNKFIEDFKEHQGDPTKVRVVACDMSLGFKKGIMSHMPQSDTVIDKFHVIKHCNEAVDTVRKQESREQPSLRGTKYLWLKNEFNLSDAQMEKKKRLSEMNLKTGKAYRMRVALQDIYEGGLNKEEASARMDELCEWMVKSGLEPMQKMAQLIQSHRNDILNYWTYNVTNALLEGINSIIQNVKRRARGFRSNEYFKTMIYLTCSDLDFERVCPSIAVFAR